MHNILNGTEAINWHEVYGVGILAKYADPTEEARAGLAVDEAREIAREDAGLIALFVSVTDVRKIEVPNHNIGWGWWDALHEANDAQSAPEGLRAAVEMLCSPFDVVLPVGVADELLPWLKTLPDWEPGLVVCLPL